MPPCHPLPPPTNLLTHLLPPTPPMHVQAPRWRSCTPPIAPTPSLSPPPLTPHSHHPPVTTHTRAGASVEKLHAAYHAHAGAGRAGPLLVDGCPVEDLCLSFVLPGYPTYELAPNGAEVRSERNSFLFQVNTAHAMPPAGAMHALALRCFCAAGPQYICNPSPCWTSHCFGPERATLLEVSRPGRQPFGPQPLGASHLDPHPPACN